MRFSTRYVPVSAIQIDTGLVLYLIWTTKVGYWAAYFSYAGWGRPTLNRTIGSLRGGKKAY
jgi:hypothetical protein